MDTNETYYEVPHWMHLSFISYDREEHQLGDHIHHDDLVSPAVKQNRLDSFELGPNGFLRRKPEAACNAAGAHNTGSPPMKPKSPSSTFSALGNKAATPGKAKSQQERQLISGRDFRDILEACRPRISGMRLPSALLSILKIYDFAQEREKAKLEGASFRPKTDMKADQHKHVALREWGTVHFHEFPVRAKPKLFRSDSPASRRSPSDSNIEKIDDSESESNASSFRSHVSSIFGMSYDRVLWDNYDSPVLNQASFLIQRSQSLEFDKATPNLVMENAACGMDDFMSVDTDNASGGGASPGDGDRDWTQTDNDTIASHPSTQAKHVETLWKLMEAHDELVWAPKNTNISIVGDMNVIRPESIQHVESEVTISSSKRGQSISGGLGAALSQYSSTFSKEGQPSTLLTRRASGSFLPSQGRSGGNKDRIRAQSPLLPTLTSRGISPMLLPSMLSLPRQHSGIIDPPFNLKSEQGHGYTSHRSLGMENNLLASRDVSGFVGLVSGSNVEYPGYQNTTVRSPLICFFAGLFSFSPLVMSGRLSSYRQYETSYSSSRSKPPIILWISTIIKNICYCRRSSSRVTFNQPSYLWSTSATIVPHIEKRDTPK